MESSRKASHCFDKGSSRVNSGLVAKVTDQGDAKRYAFPECCEPVVFAVILPRTSPTQAAKACRMFLDKELPASVEALPCNDGQKWRVSATVFLDYVPLTIELRTCEAANGATSIAMRHISRSDVVRFKHIFMRVVEFLRSTDLIVTAAHGNVGFAPLEKRRALVDGEFEDLTDRNLFGAIGHDCPERVRLSLADLDSLCPSVREHALQALARLAASSSIDHLAMAEGFAKRSNMFERVFFEMSRTPVPLAEMYPLAVALRTLVCGPSLEAMEVLRKSPIAKMFDQCDWTLSRLPPLVARELITVAQKLQVLLVQKSLPGAIPCFVGDATRSADPFADCSTQCLDGASTLESFTSTTQSVIQIIAHPAQCTDRQISQRLRNMLVATTNLFESDLLCDSEKRI